jgi:trans-aconitate methyltransferase
MNCVICNSKDNVSFKDRYILEIEDDKDVFEGAKIYSCKECDVSFVFPMPSDSKLDDFYKNVYRTPYRPPYFLTENYEDLKLQCLDDRYFNYLVYLTSLVDLNKVKKLYDFGAGNGDLGYLLKKKFPNLELYCTESDKYCKKLLKERGYKNLENLDEIQEKFDLIITLHSLEHLTSSHIFSKFCDFLNKDGSIFFEVPNCTKKYFDLRVSDTPHLIFYTKKSFEKIAQLYNLEFINFSYAFYPIEYDRKFSLDSKKLYEKNYKSKLSYIRFKIILKKIIPKIIINFRRDLYNLKRINSEDRVNWFVNNTGNNSYIRGILKKNK